VKTTGILGLHHLTDLTPFFSGISMRVNYPYFNMNALDEVFNLLNSREEFKDFITSKEGKSLVSLYLLSEIKDYLRGKGLATPEALSVLTQCQAIIEGYSKGYWD